ncbi:MAG: hypothetical protein SOY31_00565 [Bacilli bacterium]|nr:hypothetical protein [Bacilli bacterium]
MLKKEAFERFNKEISSSSVLNVNLEDERRLELVSPSLDTFFTLLFRGKRIKFETVFEKDYVSSVDDSYIKVKDERILRKNKYTKSEIEKYIYDFKENEVTSTSLPIYQDVILEKLSKKDYIFLAYGNVYYKRVKENTISISPSIFFKCHLVKVNNEFYLELIDSTPYFNKSLNKILKDEYGLDMSFNEESFDIREFSFFVEKNIRHLYFAIDESMYLGDYNIIEENRRAYLAVNERELEFKNNYRSIDETIVDDKILPIYIGNYPQYVIDAFNEINKNPVSKIAFDSKLSGSFIEHLIDEYILSGKNILFVTKDKKRTEEIKKSLFQKFYDMFIPYRDIAKPNVALFTLLEALDRKNGYQLDSERTLKSMELKELINEKNSLDVSLKSISTLIKETKEETFENYYSNYQKSNKIYNFETFTSYKEDMYEDDEKFLSFLRSNEFFLNNSFVNHPFYGLNSEVEYDDYESIHKFLISFIEDIERFEKAIEDSRIKISNWSDFNSIRDFDEANTHFEIFEDYNGFDTKLFDVDFSQAIRDSLTKLKECYRKEASIKLAINVSTDEAIWNYNFRELLESLKGKSEKKIKKDIRKLLKLNTKTNYESLIILLDKFEENKDEINALVPMLETYFGSLSYSLDGISFVEDAIAFIDSYSRHRILYSKLNFDNDFTKLIFSDKKYLEEYKSIYYPELTRLRDVFEKNLDTYRTYFNEDKFDYTQASFKDIKERLQARIDASKDKYDEYLNFSKLSDNASPLLRSALIEEEENEASLKLFEANFRTSLYQFLLKNAMDVSSGVNLVEEQNEVTFKLYNFLKKEGDLYRVNVNDEFDAIRKKLIINDSFNRSIKELKCRYHVTKLLSTKKALVNSSSLFYHLYPLEIKDINSIDFLEDTVFDLVIIDIDEISEIDLFYLLNRGKRILFINSKKYDSYLSNVKEIKFDLSKDLYVNSVSSLITSVKKNLKKNGIELEFDKVIDEGVTIPFYFEYQNEKFALRFEEEGYSSSEVSNYYFPKDLFLTYGIKIVTLYLIPYIVYDELSIMSLYNDVRKKMKEEAEQSNPLNLLGYEEQRKIKYFQMLDSIDNSFKRYEVIDDQPSSLEEGMFKSSSLEERPVSNISVFDVANGIITYLTNFTFLSKDTLIEHMSKVIGTTPLDIDFRLLFARATNLLVEKNIIKVNGSRYFLVR